MVWRRRNKEGDRSVTAEAFRHLTPETPIHSPHYDTVIIKIQFARNTNRKKTQVPCKECVSVTSGVSFTALF